MLIASGVKTATFLAAFTVLAACSNETPRTPDAPVAPMVATPETADGSGKNWLEQVTTTPDGGFMIGNPDAPVKLVEYASLTCPHCRDFHETAMPTVRGQYIATGKLSYEFRNFILNPADYAATMLSRCSGPNAFFALTDAFFKNQSTWIEPFSKLSKEQADALASLSPDEQIVRYAKLGGLDEFMRARGVPASRFDACLTDAAQRGQLETLRKTAIEGFKVAGTPSFVINGTLQDGVYSWAALEPKLKAAVN